MSKLRTGDISLFDELDGGEISVVNGEPKMDGGFESSVYIALEGHENDKLNWMDEYTTESEKIGGRFAAFIKAVPKTIANINKAEQLALLDLDSFLSDNQVDKIDVTIIDNGINKISMLVEMSKDRKTIFENEYQINWEFQLQSPANERT